MTTNPGAFENPEDPGGDWFPFSELRGLDLPAEASAARRLIDVIAALEEEGPPEGSDEYGTAISYLVTAVLTMDVNYANQVAELRKRIAKLEN